MALSKDIYRIEENFLSAIGTILSQAGLQVCLFGDEEVIEVPRIEVAFSIQGVMPEPTQTVRLPDGRRLQTRYTAMVQATIVTSARSAKADHFALIARVRDEFSYLTPKLVSPTLSAFYAVHNIHEQSSQHGVGSERDDERLSNLSFAVVFSINPSAFAD